MHRSSLLKMQSFRECYLPPSQGMQVRVLDVGSMAHDEQDSYRPVFGHGFQYTGLDVVAGSNVDLYHTYAYEWSEIPTG